MKILARGSFLLVTILWGSFYAVAKVALTHIDPLLLTFFEALTLVPLALTLLVLHRYTLTLAACKRGVLLGSCLCLATLTITVSEHFTGATNTAFFPSTGGIFATMITATVLRRSLRKSIWVACALSLLGVVLIFRASLSGPELRGDVIALLGALLFTVYLFLVEQDAQHEGRQFWAIVGVEHLSFALWMTLFSLLFGDWQHFHPVLTQDVPVMLYVALICTFLPVLLTHFAQRSLDPLETGFLSILEPLWGVIIAHFALGEVVPRSLYLGGAFILAGTVVHLLGTGDVPQMVMCLGQRGMNSTRTALTSCWQQTLVFISMVLIIMSTLHLLLRQQMSHVYTLHLGSLYRDWREHHLRNANALLVGLWFTFFAEKRRWDWSLNLSLACFPLWHPILCAGDGVMGQSRKTQRDNALTQYHSLGCVACFLGSVLTSWSLCFLGIGWWQPFQQCASP